MVALVFISTTLVLLVGFLALTVFEERRDRRFFATERARLDATVERIEYLRTHVNFIQFFHDELRHLLSRLGHDIVRISLTVVRAVERLLTRTVRRLRANPEVDPAPRETAREFVKTLSEFKNDLKATHPDRSDIH